MSIEKAKKILTEIEWTYDTCGDQLCMCCDCFKEEGHDKQCQFAKALAELEAADQEVQDEFVDDICRSMANAAEVLESGQDIELDKAESKPNLTDISVPLPNKILLAGSGKVISKEQAEKVLKSKPELMGFIELVRTFLPPKKVFENIAITELSEQPGLLERLSHEACDRLENQAEQLAAKQRELEHAAKICIEQANEIVAKDKENSGLLDLTRLIDEHPEDYEGPCMCGMCMNYDK